jgi:hypothetical protein
MTLPTTLIPKMERAHYRRLHQEGQVSYSVSARYLKTCPISILYWQICLENCECLLKLIHTPTVNLMVQNAVNNDFHNLNKSDELLMFCFYFAATTSLTEDETMHQFGQEKASLLESHELAIKHGLA